MSTFLVHLVGQINLFVGVNTIHRYLAHINSCIIDCSCHSKAFINPSHYVLCFEYFSATLQLINLFPWSHLHSRRKYCAHASLHTWPVLLSINARIEGIKAYESFYLCLSIIPPTTPLGRSLSKTTSICCWLQTVGRCTLLYHLFRLGWTDKKCILSQ